MSLAPPRPPAASRFLTRSRVRLFSCCFAAVAACLASTARAQDETELRGHEGSVYSLSFSPSGDILVSGGADNTVKFWRFAPERISEEEMEHRKQLIAELEDDRFEVRQEAFQALKFMGREIQPSLIDALQVSETTDARLRIRFLLAGLATPVGVGHREDVRCVAFSPDARTVASASGDNTIAIWNVASGRPLLSIRAHTDGVWSVAFSPDGKTLASGGGDHMVRLWQADSGEPLGALAGHHSTIHRLAFSPDGNLLASAGSFDDSARVWDVKKQLPLTTMDKHTDAVLCVAFSPDGKQVVSSGYGGTVHLWRSDDGSLHNSIDTKHGIVRTVAFSPDGDQLATGGDRTVELWDLSSLRQTKSFPGDSEQVYSIAFSPKGDRLAASGKDGIIRCWNLRK